MTQPILPSRKRANKKNSYPVAVEIRDVYKFYTKKHGTPLKGGCPSKIFRAVINEFNAWMADELIRGVKFVLPVGMGCLEVVEKRQKFVIVDGELKKDKLPVDWPKTWEYWKTNPKAASEKKLLFYTNEHTNGFKYKPWWDKYNTRIHNLCLYAFKPSRLLSRRLAAHILNPDTVLNYEDRC